MHDNKTINVSYDAGNGVVVHWHKKMVRSDSQQLKALVAQVHGRLHEEIKC